MSPKQKKLAAKAPPPNKLDEKDFKVLREEKAKGRGMGLQDESKKPGKIYKAKRGMSFSDKMKAVEDGKINKKTGKPTSMAAMREMKGFKPGESAAEFNKRRMMLAGAKKAARATTIGKIVLPIAAAGVAAQQYLKGKMKKDKNKKTLKDFREQKKPGIPSEKTKTINSALNKLNKKMGGGMMQKPMGYKIGTGEKPLETAMNKKRAEQTKNVKRLTTQSDAYDPEIRFLHASKKTRSGSSNVLRRTTDQVNLKEARNKFKEELPRGFNVRIKTSEEMRPRRAIGKYSKGTMVKARGCKLGRTRPTKIT